MFYNVDPSPSPYKGIYTNIDLSWWPIVSITFSVIAILISFLKISKAISSEHGKFYGLALFFPVFLFRMISWQVTVLLLAENTFWLFGIEVLLNLVIVCLTWNEDETFQLCICYAIQSGIFPMNKLIIKQKEHSSLKTVFWMVTVGNFAILVALLVIFFAGLIGPWNSNQLITEDWFKLIILSLIPLFFAASIPIVIEQATSMYRSNFYFSFYL